MRNLAIGVAIFAIAGLVLPVACDSDDDSDDDAADDDETSDDDISDDDHDGDDDSEDPCQDGMNEGEPWQDSSSGLIWQTGNTCDNRRGAEVTDYCEALAVGGYSDWRVPTISELRTLIRGCPATESGGECNVTDECYNYGNCENDACGGCDENNGPTDGCYSPQEVSNPCGRFWSSTRRSDTSSANWIVSFVSGRIMSSEIGDDGEGDVGFLVRCVRDNI
ncbi:MAG: DUF1566 domain-containing protein [Deltaproteobacteria bacterium]|nr:DUF1566 domain-containing protein [Deltaproteobacteria bacterium]